MQETYQDLEKQLNSKLSEVVEYNDKKYNFYKLAEELAELSEVVLKLANKKEEYKPPISKLEEEAGDVLCRLYIVLKQENAIDGSEIRFSQKLESLLSKIKQGLYKGGV